MRCLKLLVISFVSLLLTACDVDLRLSSAVMFWRQEANIAEWLKTPKYYFLESYVRFDNSLDKSVIFGIDQEMLEGTKNPIHFPGADWMGLIGMQRDGKIWVATGTDETMQGKPSKDRNWVYLNIEQPLQANTWYRLHSIVDYSTRKYVSFTIEGPDIKKTFDLSAYTVDYPNMLPFDERSMTNLVWAIGGRALGTPLKSNTKVYFDDVRSGLAIPVSKDLWEEKTLFTESFETQSTRFSNQPWSYMDIITDKVIALKKYQDGQWYLEREMALARPTAVNFAHNGKTVAVMDASIENIKYEDWLKRETGQ